MRVAAFQRIPMFDDLAGVGESLRRDLAWADDHEVDLILFPECYLLGHAYDRSTIERRALPLDDPKLNDTLGKFASARATIILGMFERRPNGIYNSAIVISSGKILGGYSKSHPNEDGVVAGSEFPIFVAGDWQFGINICYDANYPDSADRIAEQGAGLLCYPLNNLLKAEKAAAWRSRSIENLQARAVQTQCWVMSADVVGQMDSRISYGCTAIVRPDGSIAAHVPELVEGVAVFDLT